MTKSQINSDFDGTPKGMELPIALSNGSRSCGAKQGYPVSSAPGAFDSATCRLI
jgi:hypothetical protein